MPPMLETRLREADRVRRSRRAARPRCVIPRATSRGIASAGCRRSTTAAVVGLVVYLVLPRLGAPTSLSASEILGRSLQTLTGAHGSRAARVRARSSPACRGPHRIEQLLDHDHPSRYRIADYGPDGDADSRRSARTRRRAGARICMRVDGRNYIVDADAAQTPLALAAAAGTGAGRDRHHDDAGDVGPEADDCGRAERAEGST